VIVTARGRRHHRPFLLKAAALPAGLVGQGLTLKFHLGPAAQPGLSMPADAMSAGQAVKQGNHHVQ
jgi:hypothetical protein